MATNVKQVLENALTLSAEDKAKVVHCLISSLDTQQDKGVDAAWAQLAEERLEEIESGKVKTVSWQQIKANVKNG